MNRPPRLGSGLLPALLGGNPTPTPSVGNLVLASNWADFLAKYAAANASGDVISIDHAGYTPSGPQTLTINRSMTDLVLIGASNQVVQLVVNGQANCNTELVQWDFSGDARQGNTNIGVNNYSSYVNNSSGLKFSNCNFGQGSYSNYLSSSSSIVYENSNIFYSRGDSMQVFGNVDKLEVRNVWARDTLFANIHWYKFGSPTLCQAADPGGGYTKWDAVHTDAIQAFGGALTNFLFDGYNTSSFGQAMFITGALGGTHSLGKVVNCTLSATYANQLILDAGTNNEVSSNTFVLHPDPFPGAAQAIYFDRTVGGLIRTGLNTIPVGYTVSGPFSRADMIGPMTGDTVTPPAPSAYQGSPSNVGGLATKRLRRTLTPYSGQPTAMTPIGALFASNAGPPYASGTIFEAMPGQALGCFQGMEAGFQWEHFVNGVSVSGPTTGLTGMQYAPPDGEYQVRWRGHSTTAWSPLSTSVTVGVAVGAWDPANKNAGITLSNANNTATNLVAGLNAVRSVAGMLADGKYYYEITPNFDTNAGNAVGAVNASHPLNTNIGNLNGFELAKNGNVRGNNVFKAALGARTGGVTLGIAVSITGGLATKRAYFRDNTGWLGAGGDPGGAGAGINMDNVTGGIYAAWNGQAGTGENATLNTGKTAFVYSIPTGYVALNP